MKLLCFFCLVLCFCARLFICALWSPAGQGLTSWLSFVVSNFEFGHFLGQVWYLMVSIPDLCTLTHFKCMWQFYLSCFFFRITKTEASLCERTDSLQPSLLHSIHKVWMYIKPQTNNLTAYHARYDSLTFSVHAIYMYTEISFAGPYT